jgi:S1-C subfamily serine protease
MLLKRFFQALLLLFLGILGGMLWQAILLPFFSQEAALEKFWFIRQFKSRKVIVLPKEETIIQENQAITLAAGRVEKSIVGIKTIAANGSVFSGSGLIVTTDGWIVSLADLFPARSVSSLYINGEKSDFEIIKRDIKRNLVLLAASSKDLPTCGFADIKQLRRGQRVFLAGDIFLSKKPTRVVNEGIVKYFGSNFIRTNIFEEKSLAGSALFDIEGAVLGINFIDFDGKVTAIPIDKIRDFAGI